MSSVSRNNLSKLFQFVYFFQVFCQGTVVDTRTILVYYFWNVNLLTFELTIYKVDDCCNCADYFIINLRILIVLMIIQSIDLSFKITDKTSNI